MPSGTGRIASQLPHTQSAAACSHAVFSIYFVCFEIFFLSRPPEFQVALILSLQTHPPLWEKQPPQTLTNHSDDLLTAIIRVGTINCFSIVNMPRDLAKSVRHCSADNPFPVVIPLERPNVASRIRDLHKQCQKLPNHVDSVARTDQLHFFYSSLMDAVCSLVGVDGSKYPNCVDACIAMCMSTNVYKATAWKNWDGLRSFDDMMKTVRQLTRETNMIHCPTAPHLMVVIAIKEVVLCAKERRERSHIADFLKVFDCYNKAASAICYFDKGNRQYVLALDQPWVLTASVQRPPTRLIDQSEFTTSRGVSGGTKLVPKDNDTEDVEMDEDPAPIKIESSPECEAEPASGHQTMPHAVQQAALHAVTEPGSLRARTPAMNQYTPPFEHQDPPFFARQSTELGERRCEGPTAISMPKQESTAAGGTHVQVTREEVMEHLQPLFNRLKYEDWAGGIRDDILRVLTKQTIKVVTPEAKGMLGLWAGKTQNGTVLTWLEQAKEDLTVFQWVETDDPSAAMLWYTGHIHTIFHDINVTIGAVSEPTVREELRAQVGSLRDIIFATNK